MFGKFALYHMSKFDLVIFLFCSITVFKSILPASTACFQSTVNFSYSGSYQASSKKLEVCGVLERIRIFSKPTVLLAPSILKIFVVNTSFGILAASSITKIVADIPRREFPTLAVSPIPVESTLISVPFFINIFVFENSFLEPMLLLKSTIFLISTWSSTRNFFVWSKIILA